MKLTLPIQLIQLTQLIKLIQLTPLTQLTQLSRYPKRRSAVVSKLNMLSLIPIFFFLFSIFSTVSLAAETQTLMIESQVKGSQAQPKVIYIMPWQNMQLDKKLKLEDDDIQLPELQPIYPKAFKQAIKQHAQSHNNSQQRKGS
ncbi:hypothetical protein [Catenovulum sediminis]|uniref:Uncharacterized protein n=1 Tax=Catenovulum sediminis TaxID=1740262 RepID=A0ABV1RL57_9ALTE|nr:hypothetical protein [Catenovulum sediminis]